MARSDDAATNAVHEISLPVSLIHVLGICGERYQYLAVDCAHDLVSTECHDVDRVVEAMLAHMTARGDLHGSEVCNPRPSI